MEDSLLQSSQFSQKSNRKEFLANKKNILILIIVVFSVTLLIATIAFALKPNVFKNPPTPSSPKNKSSQNVNLSLSKFSSEQEFKEYIQKSQTSLGGFGPLNLPMAQMSPVMKSQGISADSGTSQPFRVSQTNVQVKGIDEPDIIKTDGKNIYFSKESGYFYPVFNNPASLRGSVSTGIVSPIMPPESKAGTKIINAFPPESLSEKKTIEQSGDLLINNNILTIFGQQNIFGIDISDSSNPIQKWKIDLDKNQQIVTSRLYKDKIYLVTSSQINIPRPCPLMPVSLEGVKTVIPCIQIYHPNTFVPSDITYVAMVIDPNSGKVEKSLAIVGSAGRSIVYMSQESLYITYSYTTDQLNFELSFYQEKGSGLVADSVLKQLSDLKNLNISDQAKQIEMQVILDRYLSTLSDDERLKIENETQNKLKVFSQERAREFEKTGIAKIDLANLEINSTGSVPGSPLNQFSLDEYQNNFRVATTIGGSFGSSDSANDVYILDKNLKNIGSIISLGLGERIYSVRFINNSAYLVTFKQVDPFFILDLSNPQRPEVKGQLKIPGYSSYLDPIADSRILGIGKEDNKVKLSLFDVSDSSNPKEIAKYSLDEYWSDVENTHHAFLLDDRNKIFFLPGSKGGYIFSYDGDSLSLKKVISGNQLKRAVFIDNYLYIVGADKIVALDESNWQEVKSVTFNQ